MPYLSDDMPSLSELAEDDPGCPDCGTFDLTYEPSEPSVGYQGGTYCEHCGWNMAYFPGREA